MTSSYSNSVFPHIRNVFLWDSLRYISVSFLRFWNATNQSCHDRTAYGYHTCSDIASLQNYEASKNQLKSFYVISAQIKTENLISSSWNTNQLVDNDYFITKTICRAIVIQLGASWVGVCLIVTGDYIMNTNINVAPGP